MVHKSKTSLENELNFSTSKISRNFSNYSSWHYRSELLPRIYPSSSASNRLDDQRLAEGVFTFLYSPWYRPVHFLCFFSVSECNLIQNAIFTDPSDQSAWFYQRWLLFNGNENESASIIPTLRSELESCQQLYDLEPENKCTFIVLEYYLTCVNMNLFSSV